MNLSVTSSFANSADIQMDSRLIGLDKAKGMVYIIIFLFKARFSLVLLGCGILAALYSHKRSTPPVFHTFGWQKDASFPIRNSIFSIHAWVSTNSRLLIPRLRYVVWNFRKKERQCMATSPILLRTERHASWYFSIRTRFEISSNKMRNVSLEPYYTLPWC